MKSLTWNVLSDASANNANLDKISLVQAVMNVRGFQDDDSLPLNEQSGQLFDPFLLKDMQKAVAIISNAIESDVLICVYGDYDCDGICSTAMVHHYLESIGGRVFYYIPHREKEGYGLNISAIDEISRLGATLIITVDNGISSIEESIYAHSLGIEIVITDHHTPREILPTASAIINPHQSDCSYPFKDLCGAGVAFKLLCALEGDDGYGLIEHYGDILAIATVADIVSLVSENRFIVKEGLQLIQNSFRPGLRVILENAGLADREITSDSIAYGIAPRINAAGRIEHADIAVMLLSTESDEEAKTIGDALEELNLKRRELEKVVVDDIAKTLEHNPNIAHQSIPVFWGKGWNAGVVGIVCSRLVERFERPVLIASIEENGTVTGSGRGVENFSLIKAIADCRDLLTRYGGHPMAAGFTLKSENIAAFARDLNGYCAKELQAVPTLALTVDVQIFAQHLTIPQVKELSVLEPFGCGNAHPIFCIKSAEIVKITPLSQGKHLKIKLQSEGKTFDTILFFAQEHTLGATCKDIVDIAFTLSINEYQSVQSVSLKCLSIRLTGIDYEKSASERQDYDRYKTGGGLDSSLIPTREQAGIVYRYIKNTPELFSNRDATYYHLIKREHMPYATFCISVDALLELSHLVLKDGILSVNQLASKSDFGSSSIIRSLSERDG